jgi:hypothetical protein
MYVMQSQKVSAPIQVFVSHTKLDYDFCSRFDVAASRVGVKVFRSELEEIKEPAWETIKEAMNKSCALFLLVGKELVAAQSKSEGNIEDREKWKFTQNWIAYEIGLACQLGLDVWVVCDHVTLNFPVPYLNNYEIWGIRGIDKESLKFFREVFEEYSLKKPYPLHCYSKDRTYKCAHCGAAFNLHSNLPKLMEIPCPTCLDTLKFPEGWFLKTQAT